MNQIKNIFRESKLIFLAFHVQIKKDSHFKTSTISIKIKLVITMNQRAQNLYLSASLDRTIMIWNETKDNI